MKTMNRRHAARLGLVVILLFPLPAAAQSWTGANSNLWSDPLNWVPGAPVSSNTTSLAFAAGSVNPTPFADAAYTVRSLQIGLPIHAISGNTLTFDGANPFIIFTGTGHSIANPLVLNQDLVVSNFGEATLSGDLAGGSTGILLFGGGRLTLSGSTMYGGQTQVNGGTLRFGDGASGPGTVFDILNNGALEFDVPGGIAINSNLNGSGSLRVLGGTAAGVFGPMVYAGTTTVDAGAQLDGEISNNALLTVDGTFNTGGSTVGSLAGALGSAFNINSGIFTVGGDNTSTTYSGCIGGSGNFVKVGSGRLTLAVICTPSGDFIVNAGTLKFGDGAIGPGIVFNIVNNAALEFDVPAGIAINSNVPGSGSLTVVGGLASGVFGPMVYTGPTTINAGGQLDASITNNALLTVDGTFNTGGATVGSLTGAPGSQLNVNSGTFTVGADNASTTYSGCIGGFGDFVKVGTGRLTLAITCTLNGNYFVNAGTLAFGNGIIGPGIVFNIFNNAALEFNVPGGIAINSNLVGPGSVTVVGGQAAGVFGPLVHTGSTTVNAGAQLDASITNNAPLTLNGTLNTGGATVGSLLGAGFLNINSGTVTVGGDNASTTFSGVIAGAGSFVKAGTGVLTLAGVNTLTGGTTVAAGVLQLTGTLPGTVTVNAGATLRGTGTVAGPVVVNAGGTLSPGLSPGQINVGNLALAGVLLQEIEGTTLGTQYDNVNVTGSVNLAGATLTLAGAYVPQVGDTFTVISNDGADAVVGTFAGLAEGAAVVLNGRALRVSYVGGDGNDVVLAVAAAPGPGVNRIPTLSPWALLALAAIVLLAGGVAPRRRKA